MFDIFMIRMFFNRKNDIIYVIKNNVITAFYVRKRKKSKNSSI